jgi:small subunit ribosomal protein S6
MRLYETLCLLKPDLDEEELERNIEKVRAQIESTGGEVRELQRWGKKKLAYQIENYTEGYYVLLTFKANNKILGELKHFFKVNEPYLRYMTLRLEEKVEGKVEVEEVQPEVQSGEEEQPQDEPAAAENNSEAKEGEVIAE